MSTADLRNFFFKIGGTAHMKKYFYEHHEIEYF